MVDRCNFLLENDGEGFSPVFERIVKEIAVKEVPIKYITRINIVYHNGDIVKLGYKEINDTIPINRNAQWDSMAPAFDTIKSVTVFVDTKKLEDAVTTALKPYIGHLRNK